jgi:Zn-dependent M16 (insulinase) family peptidase
MILRNRRAIRYILLAFCIFCIGLQAWGGSEHLKLSGLKRNQKLADFRVSNLYCDPAGHIVGLKVRHIPSGTPVFILQIETVPQVFMSIDTPPSSNQGLPHALEHLLAGKGTKGRYSTLLRDMRLSSSNAATYRDFNYYSFSSGTGLDAFFEQLHAWLDALFRPDFTDTEAESEFYHIGVATDPTTNNKRLVEKGTVYDEMQSRRGLYDYYYAANQQVFGADNPLGFDPAGVVDQMRGVTPAEIRRFYRRCYRLGPTTGFVFALDPKEDLAAFLGRVSKEFQLYVEPSTAAWETTLSSTTPKYPIQSSPDTDVKILRFPSASETGPGEVLLSWRPIENSSLADLRLLRLFLGGFADGEPSLLHASLVDSKGRELESGATAVSASVSLEDSPFFPVSQIGISGIPGTKMSENLVDRLRNIVSSKLKEIADYSDRSAGLAAFNKIVAAEMMAAHRTEIVWTKSPPLFGVSGSQTAWKDHFEMLELDPGFVRSLSEEPVWNEVADRLNSGRNIWHDVIHKFHLLDIPYATASAPSRQLLEDVETTKRSRIEHITRNLMEQYQAGDEQQALARLEQDGLSKAKEIERVKMNVVRPSFTKTPPLTPDDSIRYRQFELQHVPVVASMFERPPTIDIGLSFDLGQIPPKYYKFLPLIPRCLDSLGVMEKGHVVPYSELRGKIQATTYDFSIRYPLDLRSEAPALEIRASASDMAGFLGTLALLRRIMQNNYLDISNVDRLRDVVAQNISSDDVYIKKAETDWIDNPVLALRRSHNLLFLAANSHFTQAHWNARLQWLLHKSVSQARIDSLTTFAGQILPGLAAQSKADVSKRLRSIDAAGLEGELVEYWLRNLSSFPDSDVTEGFWQLTSEVVEDLRTGPEKTIDELKALQGLILNRRALQIDLTLSPSDLKRLQPDLIDFLKSIPAGLAQDEDNPKDVETAARPRLRGPSLSKILGETGFPAYVGFVNADSISGDAVFLADFPGYTQSDEQSLRQVLSSNLLSGAGPSSLYMRTWESGLAYSNGVAGDPDTRILSYYADRSPDLSTLIQFVLSASKGIKQLPDEGLLDYVFSETFAFSRAVFSPSQRGRLLALDFRDGIRPEIIRHFSEAVIRLRETPLLLQEIKQNGFDSICGVLLEESCVSQQQRNHSIFFFIGSEGILNDAEKRLSISRMVRLYPRDYWMK